MPHFILDCADDVFYDHDRQDVMNVVFDMANESGMFSTENIKVRIRTFSDYVTGGTEDSFIHVFAYIMEGRSTAQKAALSKSLVTALTKLFPNVPVVSMNVMEFEKATSNNRATVC